MSPVEKPGQICANTIPVITLQVFTAWNELRPQLLVLSNRVVPHKPWLFEAAIRQTIVSIGQPRFKKTWRLWTFQACLGWGQGFMTWELHRRFYYLCRKKQFSLSRKAGLALTGSMRQWRDCTAHPQTLLFCWPPDVFPEQHIPPAAFCSVPPTVEAFLNQSDSWFFFALFPPFCFRFCSCSCLQRSGHWCVS